MPRNVRTFRAFSRRFLDALQDFPERKVVFVPLMFFVGFRHGTVELPRDERSHGQSSYSFRKRLALAMDCLVTYTDLPHRLLIHAGGALAYLSTTGAGSGWPAGGRRYAGDGRRRGDW